MTLLTLLYTPGYDPGLSYTTPRNLLYGQDGYVTVNSVDLGALLSDITIQWGYTPYYPDLAQARGNVSGTGIVTDPYFRLVVIVAEWQWLKLAEIMGNMGAVSTGDSYMLGAREMVKMSEVDNVIVTGVRRKDGKNFTVMIPKAFVVPGDIVLSEKKETGLQLTFDGLWSATEPKVFPGYIQIEK